MASMLVPLRINNVASFSLKVVRYGDKKIAAIATSKTSATAQRINHFFHTGFLLDVFLDVLALDAVLLFFASAIIVISKYFDC